MTEFERDWKEPETYSDFDKGCRLDVILILVFVLALLGGIYYMVQ